MADVQTARFGRYLQNLFNLKQRATLGEILPDAIPTVELDQPRPENELFLGNDLCAGHGVATGGVGQFAQVGLGFDTTPTAQSAGSIIVVDEVVINCTSTQVISLSFGSMSALASSGSVAKVDTRRYPQAPAGVVKTDTDAAAVPTAFWSASCLQNTPYFLRVPIVLAQVPGVFERAGLIVTANTALTLLRVSFRWRERPMRADELIV